MFSMVKYDKISFVKCYAYEAQFINEFCDVYFTPSQFDSIINEKIRKKDFSSTPLMGVSIIISLVNLLKKMEFNEILSDSAEGLIKSYFSILLNIGKNFIVHENKVEKIKIQILKDFINMMCSYVESELRKLHIKITILPSDDVIDDEFKKNNIIKESLEEIEILNQLKELKYEIQSLSEHDKKYADNVLRFSDNLFYDCNDEYYIDDMQDDGGKYEHNEEYSLKCHNDYFSSYKPLFHLDCIYSTDEYTYPIVCPNCGKQISYKQRYCSKCGGLINNCNKYQIIINGYNGKYKSAYLGLNTIYHNKLQYGDIEYILKNCPYVIEKYDTLEDACFYARKLLRYGINVSVINPDKQIEFEDIGII